MTNDPERIFRIVLAGDAAVGKSSFIMRLCKNKFVANLNSTLGNQTLICLSVSMQLLLLSACSMSYTN